MNTIACVMVPITLGNQTLLAAQPTTPALAAPAPSFADLANLSDRAPLVVRALVKKQVAVEVARAPGLAAGHVRLFVEVRTAALIAGDAPLGESLRYLVDVPLDAKGKAPKLKGQEFLLFARPVPGRAGEVQLVGPGAHLPFDPAIESRLRPILAQLHGADVPPRITGVRDALHVPGTLTGESETQIFLDTESQGPVSISVSRRPGMAPYWGVSWTEIVDQAARPPARETVAWYRLACSLPPRLPAQANLARDSQARAAAARDYALVIDQLGPCGRTTTR